MGDGVGMGGDGWGWKSMCKSLRTGVSIVIKRNPEISVAVKMGTGRKEVRM